VASASVDVAVDQDSAFEMFTAEIGEWYVVNQYTVLDHTKTRSLRIEPWVGGRFVDAHDCETGEGIIVGHVTAWDPPRRFVFVDGHGLDVEVTLEATDGGCRVTIEERGFDSLAPDIAPRVREHSWHGHLTEWFEQYTNSTGDSR
jgi:Activator of Hsp90 ATPase homolog 1-like protein